MGNITAFDITSRETGASAEMRAEWPHTLASHPILVTNQSHPSTSSKPQFVAMECVMCIEAETLAHRSFQRPGSAVVPPCTATSACACVLAGVRHTSQI